MAVGLFVLLDLVIAAAIGAAVSVAVGWESGALTGFGLFMFGLRQTIRWSHDNS
jgi:hypothetical protein